MQEDAVESELSEEKVQSRIDDLYQAYSSEENTQNKQQIEDFIKQPGLDKETFSRRVQKAYDIKENTAVSLIEGK